MNKVSNPKPLLKWAGGKRQLLPELKNRLPKDFNVYYEPFLGGGALLFDLCPQKAVINDLNSELANMYEVIKKSPAELCELLSIHQNNHSKEYYYQVRNIDRMNHYNELSSIEKAARIIYLNRTCYNGLYRVNKKGFYNTPIGRYKSPKILDEENIYAIHEYFTRVDIQILNENYQMAVLQANEGDFIYFDPPYDTTDEVNSFIDYTKDGFDREEQRNLKELCDQLSEKNIKWMVSNANTDFIRNLYDGYIVEDIQAKRMINSKAFSRNDATEVIIRNY